MVVWSLMKKGRWYEEHKRFLSDYGIPTPTYNPIVFPENVHFYVKQIYPFRVIILAIGDVIGPDERWHWFVQYQPGKQSWRTVKSLQTDYIVAEQTKAKVAATWALKKVMTEYQAQRFIESW